MKALYNKIIPKPVRSGNTEVDRAFDDVRRSLQEIHKLLNLSKNKDGITIDGDIYCKSLHTEPTSIYVGKVKLAAALEGKEPLLIIKDIVIPVKKLAESAFVYVSATEPENPEINDLWLKI